MPATGGGHLVCHSVPFDAIPRDAWDRLLAATPAATPFSRWTLHRAWWDAYGDTAHEQYLCLTAGDGAAPDGSEEADPDDLVAIVPLMHRHEVEPTDAATATALRRSGRQVSLVEPDAKAVFMGASYHADYATLLASPADLPAVARAVVQSLAEQPDPEHGDQLWDVVDLRRLRADDASLPALEDAFRDAADTHQWQVVREEEDVCPVATLPADGDWEAYLASLDKKSRHEIRRKMRRAESSGPLEFRLVDPTPEAVDVFIDLHQSRWGDEGLFPDTPGGERSRRFLHRLAELETAEGDGRQLQLGRMDAGGRLVFATVGFDDGTTCYFYNAGMDPEARELSPGVTGTAAYLRDRLAAGRRRFDFLRGNESYKYEWGAVDEPIHRLLVSRTGST
ncbi:MAG: GNAT family N-acetyltransferase [Chloroflexi bacterium]|nr:GNAT family N-acetyltransferase [Chloroflexota bacterium]